MSLSKLLRYAAANPNCPTVGPNLLTEAAQLIELLQSNHDILLLMRMRRDQFGDEPEEWVPVSWTDDLSVAHEWKGGATMLELRRFHYLAKHIPKRPSGSDAKP